MLGVTLYTKGILHKLFSFDDSEHVNLNGVQRYS